MLTKQMIVFQFLLGFQIFRCANGLCGRCGTFNSFSDSRYFVAPMVFADDAVLSIPSRIPDISLRQWSLRTMRYFQFLLGFQIFRCANGLCGRCGTFNSFSDSSALYCRSLLKPSRILTFNSFSDSRDSRKAQAE
jgi:hypothetical protein